MEILNNISLFTCTFNNNMLTKCMIMSLFKQLGIKIPVVIMDNGTTEFCSDDMKTVFNVIDNTNFKITKNYNQISRNHCSSIDYVLKNCIKTKYVILCDNDVLFYPSIKDLFKKLSKSNFDACGEIEKSRRGYRLFPFFCVINVEKMKQEHINYFDENDCMNNMDTNFDENGNWSSNKILNEEISGLDTGGSFLREIKEKNWNVYKISISDYINHFATASWNPKAKDKIVYWLKRNKNLFFKN